MMESQLVMQQGDFEKVLAIIQKLVRDANAKGVFVVDKAGVIRFVHPDEFSAYRRLGLEKGFMEVVSGPLVRSSYRAERALEGNNVGLPAG